MKTSHSPLLPAGSTSLRLIAIFETIEPGVPLTLEVLSRSTKVSPRTIQRALAAEGTTFSQLVENWRFKRAVELLADPDISLLDVSRRLHYAQLPSFIRAFERWTGTSPGKFPGEQ